MEMLEKSLSQLVSNDQNVSVYPTLSKQQGTVSTVSNQHGVSIPITQSVHQQQQNDDQIKANIDMVAWGKSDEQALVKDFDANLSGLGLELGAGAYNMSEVLNLPMFKQEDTIVSGNNNQNLPPLQYMLCAPTSPATKVHEETLTYLNQGHPYEIRLKKLGDLSADIIHLRLVKSFLKVVFHDRRLQYTEHQQLEGWRFSRPGDRLVNIDVPMSVGILNPREPPNMLNLVEFTWDLDKPASICIQVHCISTEFTPKKHGGERGVPFRIQIDTYQLNSNGELSQHLHSASCQIKVFKPKGADRKQKTDKDKMVKRSVQEKLKYQPSYDSTLLTECISTPLHFLQDALELNSNEQKRPSYSESTLDQTVNVDISSPSSFIMEDLAVSPGVSASSGNYARIMETSVVNQQHSIMPQNCTNSGIEPLTPSSTTSQTMQWLQKIRFGSFTKTFASFTGADMLSLNRDDLIQICGSAEGIRLYNSLRSRKIQPRLTLYMSPAVPETEGQIHVYRAFYFEKLTASELIREASSLFEQQNGGGRPHITRALYQPTKTNIHVLVTDELVSTLRDEQCFTVIVIKNEVGDGYQIILKQ